MEITNCDIRIKDDNTVMEELTTIQQRIFDVRGVKVMLDRDLAQLYGVTTGNLNKAVKRNMKRFPSDFMFQLTSEEWANLKFQFGISSETWGGVRKMPYAFTEQGLAMLSGILNSDVAINVNISIMRAFVAMRRLTTIQPTDRYEQLSAEVKQLKDYVEEILTDQNDINESTNMQLELINEAIARLEVSNRDKGGRRRIGFIQEEG